jgi:hypothetical protein
LVQIAFAWLMKVVAAAVDAADVEVLCDPVDDLLPQPDTRANKARPREADADRCITRMVVRSRDSTTSAP